MKKPEPCADRFHEFAMRSPRNRPLEILIVLAVAFWLPHFWLIERILKLRGRDDDESKDEGRHINSLPITQYPPSEAAPDKKGRPKR